MQQEAYRFHDDGLARSLPVEPLFHSWALMSPRSRINRRGATAIYGRPEDDDASFSSIGVSLAATLCEWMSDHVRMLREQFSLPQNRGAGAVDQASVERALAQLGSIDPL
jgi:hypothetical protein